MVTVLAQLLLFLHLINSVWEESLGNARDSAKTKAAWRYDVGQSGKHSLQLLHSFKAISGMNLISRLAPQSTNPTAFFFLTSAQYLTHRPQRMQNEDSFSLLFPNGPRLNVGSSFQLDRIRPTRRVGPTTAVATIIDFIYLRAFNNTDFRL